MKFNSNDLIATRRMIAHCLVQKEEIEKIEKKFGEGLITGAISFPFISEACAKILNGTEEARKALDTKIQYYSKLLKEMEEDKAQSQLGYPAIDKQSPEEKVNNYLAYVRKQGGQNDSESTA